MWMAQQLVARTLGTWHSLGPPPSLSCEVTFMRSLLHIVSWPSAGLLVLSLSGSPSESPQADAFRFQYAAKIVCAAADLSAKLGLVPQAYTTTINVHNPSDSMAAIAKKVALQ